MAEREQRMEEPNLGLARWRMAGAKFEDDGVEVHDGFFVFSPSMTWGEGQWLSM